MEQDRRDNEPLCRGLVTWRDAAPADLQLHGPIPYLNEKWCFARPLYEEGGNFLELQFCRLAS
jgi:hypothetical protein